MTQPVLMRLTWLGYRVFKDYRDVCKSLDITEKLQKLARLHQLQLTPDGLGYFGWHRDYAFYTEVIDYRKLIQDAEKRNKVFFDKFGLPAEH